MQHPGGSGSFPPPLDLAALRTRATHQSYTLNRPCDRKPWLSRSQRGAGEYVSLRTHQLLDYMKFKLLKILFFVQAYARAKS